jgi:Ran GTPase-activating protein (RanGAP) involved in mRNA processing and transport
MTSRSSPSDLSRETAKFSAPALMEWMSLFENIDFVDCVLSERGSTFVPDLSAKLLRVFTQAGHKADHCGNL